MAVEYKTYFMTTSVYIWQRIISPHMAGLASALANRGVQITYIAEEEMSETRARQGWQSPPLGRAMLRIAPDKAAVTQTIQDAQPGAIHICQGIRGNGLIGTAQNLLIKHGLKQWVVMETADDAGPIGLVRRLLYSYLFSKIQGSLAGVLAIGWRTPGWVVARGVSSDDVYPFAYFLPNTGPQTFLNSAGRQQFRFLFVGQLVKLKRVDLLITALADLLEYEFKLTVVGMGPEQTQLRRIGDKMLPGRIDWLGRLPMDQARAMMTEADCLVLPSRYDGWGAVVTEALMAGTPVVCSTACGSAGVVKASGVGGVFLANDQKALKSKLRNMIEQGPLKVPARSRLSLWAESLGVDVGADYLLRILEHSQTKDTKPAPPWEA